MPVAVAIGLIGLALRWAAPGVAETLYLAAFVIGLGGGSVSFAILSAEFARQRLWPVVVVSLAVIVLAIDVLGVVLTNVGRSSPLLVPAIFVPVAALGFAGILVGLTWTIAESRRQRRASHNPELPGRDSLGPR
jgi:hypothetical protein